MTKKLLFNLLIMFLMLMMTGLCQINYAESDQSETDQSEAQEGSIKSTSSFAEITVQSSAQSNGLVSPVQGLIQNSFQSSDINLMQGAVRFSEVDLHLPGKNGLDLVISRTYNSSDYQSFETKNYGDLGGRKRGAYAGNSSGWSFSLGMRAYIVFKYVKQGGKIEYDRILIESAEGVDEYFWDSNTNAFKPKRAGNFNKVRVVRGKEINPRTWHSENSSGKNIFIITNEEFLDNNKTIELILSNGRTYQFNNKVLRERFYNNTQQTTTEVYNIQAFEVSKIKDSYDNEILFKYNTNGSNINYARSTPSLPQIAGDVYKKWEEHKLKVDGVTACPSTLTQIKDTFDREIKINVSSYPDQLPESTWPYTNFVYYIDNIQYKNTNGNETTIQYGYSEKEKRLTSVKIGDLPPKTYSYSTYTPSSYVQYASQFEGKLLAKIVSPLESITEYEYGHAVSKEKVVTPVVVKKIVKSGDSSSESYEYQYSYPVDDDVTGHYQKMPYRPVNSEHDAYYFKNVEVDNPDLIEDEQFEFSEGFLISHEKGIYETETEWDRDNNRRETVVIKKNGVIQNQQIYKSYDWKNNPIRIIKKMGDREILDQENTYYTHSYYNSGFIARNLVHLVKSSTTKDVMTHKKRSSFNVYFTSGKNMGKIKDRYKGVDSNGTKLSSFTYDSEGRVDTVTAYGPAGPLVTSYTYNESGSTYTITKTTNNKSTESVYERYTGKPKKMTDANGATTTYTYDDYGRVIEVEGEDGRKKTWMYSSDLKETSVTAYGRTVTKKMDNFGRTIEKKYPAGEQDVQIEYYFGGAIDKLYLKENGSWIEKKDIDYDTYLRKVKIKKAGWNAITYRYDSDSDWTVSDVTVTDYKGRESTSYSDSMGRLIRSHYAPDNSDVIYTYNNFGERVQMIDSKGLIHDVDYDNYGQVISTYYTYKNGERKKKSFTEYHDNGMVNIVTTLTDWESTERTKYTYDEQGRLLTTSVDGNEKETLYYDGSGQSNGVDRLTAVENEDAKSVFDYDEMGRLKKETTTIKAINKTVAIETDYTQTDQVKEMRYTDGKSVNYDYDSHHRVSTIRYDGNSIVTYTYNENGTVDYMTYGNGMEVDYTYEREEDSSKRDGIITKVEVKKSSSGDAWYYETYTYDDFGNMKTNNRLHSMSQEEGQKVYSYNNRDELVKIGLTAASLANGNNADFKSYSYDLNGNITTFGLRGKSANSPITTTREIDSERDQIETITYSDGKTMAITYDPDGNLIKKMTTKSDGSTTVVDYDYNDFSELKTVKKDGVIQAQYGYDSKGLMVYSDVTDPGNTVRSGKKYYYWDVGGQCIGEGHTSYGDHVVRYIYSGNEKIAMIRPKKLNDSSAGEEIFWFINNLQGTPVRIVDENKKTVSSIELDEWGNPSKKTYIENRSEINFTGKKYEPVTGLIYFGARFYDPELGVFLTEDPAGQYSNPYLYGANNPLMYVDPDGEWFFSALLTFVAPGLGTAIGIAIDSALWAGTTAAVIDAGIQYAVTGTVDWGRVGTSFVRGTVMGGIGAAAGAIGIGANFGLTGVNWLDKAINVGVSSGVSNAVYTGLWEKEKNMLDSFGVGFAWGFAGSAAASGIGKLTSKQAGVEPVRSDKLNSKIRESRINGDTQHSFPDIIDNNIENSVHYKIRGGDGFKYDLYQIQGSWEGKSGVFEWIINNGEMEHRRFIPGGKINGIPNFVSQFFNKK